MTRLWCNEQWLDPLDFPVSPTDRGIMLGLGLFETILAIDGVPIQAGQHLERLRGSCKRLGWNMVIPDLEPTMVELIHKNDLATGRARLRLSISGGSGMVHSLAMGADSMMWMQAVGSADPPMATTAMLSPFLRNERSALVGLKCASYAECVVALDHAGRLGFEETLFLNTAGNLCEAATANVFLVKNGALYTPSLDSGCLPGITRETVIKIAARLGIACVECDLKMSDLNAADEMFLTSSIRGVMAVSLFDDCRFEDRRVTDALRSEWQQTVSRNAEV